MKRRFNVDSSVWLYCFGLILLIGSVTSGVLNNDKRWMSWHFSRLGEGGTFSAFIFNTALLFAAVMFFMFGKTLVDGIAQIKTLTIGEVQYAKKRLGYLFRCITVCLVVVSFFPFDRFPVIHNIFGYSMLFIFIYLCIFISKVLPIFPKRYYNFGYSIIGVALICYILFLGFAAITLLQVETILFSLLYVWLILLIKGVENALNATGLQVQKVEV